MITVKTGRPLARRQAYQGRADPEIRRSFSCPKCGRAHHARECGQAGIEGLDSTSELARLRERVGDEVLRAVRHDAPRSEIRPLLELLDAIDARPDRLMQPDA